MFHQRSGGGGSRGGGFGRRAKERVNLLFGVHGILTLLLGLLAILGPEYLVWFLHRDSWHERHEGGAVRLAFIVMRVFGSFMVAQAWLLYVLRSITEGKIRRAFVQAYFAAFLLTTVALGRAQLTESTPRWSNWIVILLFAGLTLCYAWFSFIERIQIFEGLDYRGA